jgi:hypothetical protein
MIRVVCSPKYSVDAIGWCLVYSARGILNGRGVIAVLEWNQKLSVWTPTSDQIRHVWCIDAWRSFSSPESGVDVGVWSNDASPSRVTLGASPASHMTIASSWFFWTDQWPVRLNLSWCLVHAACGSQQSGRQRHTCSNTAMRKTV